jgi:hypothetical protein
MMPIVVGVNEGHFILIIATSSYVTSGVIFFVDVTCQERHNANLNPTQGWEPIVTFAKD